MGSALEGLKVLDFTWWVAGSLATKCLADFGATVIKVESRTRPDLWRFSEPFKDGRTDFNTSGLFLQGNTGKYSITLNLSKPKGLEVAKRLVSWCDVVVENFSPGTMKRLGLGYEVLKEIKPDIIMVSSSCLGQRGVYTDLRGHAFVSAAISGNFHLCGYPDGGPVTLSSSAYTDVVQPLFTVIAIISSLEYRRRSGRGQYIDITQIEPVINFIAPAILDLTLNKRAQGRVGNCHPQACPHNAFPCKGEDRWCAIAVFTQEQWQGLCQAMGNPSWSQDPRFATLIGRKKEEEELDRLIGEWTLNYTPDEVMDRLQRQRIPAAVVQNAEDIVSKDPHLRERCSFLHLNHPVMGSCIHPTPPIRLSKCPAQVKTAPLIGEHNEYIYTQIAKLSDEEYARLVGEGVFD